MLSTQGIILRTVKYGETSLILDVYTKEKGLISCIVSGVRKKKSGLSSLYQLMTVLNLTVYYKGGGGLNRIKEAKPVVHYKTILFDPLKRMIILYIAELVQKCLKENEGSERVFNFIHKNFILFDDMEIGVSNFHLFFSMELTRYLGFYPEDNNAALPYFNFLQGTFTNDPTVDQTLNEHQSQAFSALINQPLEAIQQMKFSGQERMDLLNSFIKFYQCHVSNFGTMNSPEILHVVLST